MNKLYTLIVLLILIHPGLYSMKKGEGWATRYIIKKTEVNNIFSLLKRLEQHDYDILYDIKQKVIGKDYAAPTWDTSREKLLNDEYKSYLSKTPLINNLLKSKEKKFSPRDKIVLSHFFKGDNHFGIKVVSPLIKKKKRKRNRK